jgi:hypothetical protein
VSNWILSIVDVPSFPRFYRKIIIRSRRGVSELVCEDSHRRCHPDATRGLNWLHVACPASGVTARRITRNLDVVDRVPPGPFSSSHSRRSTGASPPRLLKRSEDLWNGKRSFALLSSEAWGVLCSGSATAEPTE